MSSPWELALLTALLGENELVRAGAIRLAEESLAPRRSVRPALAEVLRVVADRLESVARPTVEPSITAAR